MLLAIDIGNTNISFGVFAAKHASKSGEIVKRFDLCAKSYSKSKLAKKLGNFSKITDTVICSVVPKLTGIVQSDLKHLIGKTPYIIGKDLVVPIKNLYRKPKQVGQDRLVNAYAAGNLYQGPLMVIDSGTAITFDVISKSKAYLGGLIFPGMRLSLDALKEKTALLPQVKLTKPKEFIGRDTKNSILSGIVFGIAALSQELAKKIKKSLGQGTAVIGTGGDILLIKKYSGIKMKIDRNLTLKGINCLYENKI